MVWISHVSLRGPKSNPESTLWWLKISMASRSSNCAAKWTRAKLSRHLSCCRRAWVHISRNLTSETLVVLFKSSSKHLEQRPMASIAALHPKSLTASTGTFWAIRYLSTACKKNKQPTGKQNHNITCQSTGRNPAQTKPSSYGQRPFKRTVGE